MNSQLTIQESKIVILNGHVAGQNTSFAVKIDWLDPINYLSNAVRMMKPRTLAEFDLDELIIYKLGDDSGISADKIKYGPTISQHRDEKANYEVTPLVGTRRIYEHWKETKDTSCIHFVLELPNASRTQVLPVTSTDSTFSISLDIQATDICMTYRQVFEFKSGDTISTLLVFYRKYSEINQSFEVVYREGGVEEMTAETDLLVAGGNYYLRFAVSPPGTPWDTNIGGPVFELIRSTKLKQLLNHVAEHRAVMVRAPPMIGKTVLGKQLLRYRALFNTVEWLDLSNWIPETHSIENFCGIKLPETHADLVDMPRTLWIFDEAQKLNHYPRTHRFWTTVKAVENQLSPKLHIILLAVYGESPSSQAILTEHLATPVLNFKLDFNIVLFDRSEFDIIVHKYNSATKGVQIHDRVSDFVFHYLGGHPGLTATLLRSLHLSSDSVSLRNKCEIDQTYSTNDILNLIIDRINEFRGMRCLPSLVNSKLSSQSKEVLQLLFDNGGEIPIMLCSDEHQDGVAPLLSGYYISARGGTYRFATPFHYFYYLSRCPRIASTTTINELVEWSLRSLDISALRNPYSVGVNRLVLKDAFKCALVVQLTARLPREWQCHAEVGAFYDCPGRVDLWIMPNRWAIELLRNYGQAQEHYERFQPGGRYTNLNATDYLVINIVEEKDVSCCQVRLDLDLPNVWHLHWDHHSPFMILKRHGQVDQKLHCAISKKCCSESRPHENVDLG